MKKLIIILASLFTFGLAIGAASAQTVAPLQGWCELGGQKVLTSGSSSSTFVQASYPKCQVEVFLTGTHNHPAQIYSNTGLTPLANPFTAQTNGSWLLYSTTGVGVDIVLSGGTPNSFPAPYTLVDQSPGGGGGGSGGVSQILAGSNITISPTNGLGAVTINSPGGGGGSFEWLNTDTFITSPPGNNGIANAIASSNCTPNGCTAIQPADSTSTEVPPIVNAVWNGSGLGGMNWPQGTHIVDTTNGQVTEFFKDPFSLTYLTSNTLPYAAPHTSSVQFSTCNPNVLNANSLQFPNCGMENTSFEAMGGGYNEFGLSLPSFKTNYQSNVNVIGMHTGGQMGGGGKTFIGAGFGDVLMGDGVTGVISGGCGDNADECQHVSTFQVQEANSAMLFKCTAGCGTGVNSFTFSPVPGEEGLTIGDEMYVQDIQNPVTSASLGVHIIAGREQGFPLAYFTMSGNLPTDAWMAVSTAPVMCGTQTTSGASSGTNVSIPVTSSGACLAGTTVLVRGAASVLATIQSIPDATHIVLASLTTSVGTGAFIGTQPISQAGTVTVTIQTPAAYNSGTTYSQTQVVTSGGLQYMSTVNSNINNTPVSSPNQWQQTFGIQSSTSALAASGIACVADAARVTGLADYYETVPWTKTGSSTLSMTFQKPHPAPVMIGIGGLCQTQIYPNAHLYGNLSDGSVGQANSILGNFGPIVLIADYAAVNAIEVNAGGESEITYRNASSTTVTRTSNVVSINTNTNWQMNGHSLAISGCVDPAYDATAVVTATSSSSFTYPNSGSNGSTSGCTVVDDNAEFTIVPAVKIRRIMNPTTKSIDGTIGALYPNSVAINNTDQLLSPHFAHMAIGGPGSTALLGQTIPRPDFFGLNSGGSIGVTLTQRPGTDAIPFFVINSANTNLYQGLGGYKNPPLASRGGGGVFQWNIVDNNAGMSGWAIIGCRPAPIGCNSWNSGYTLFDLNAPVADGLITWDPVSHELNMFTPGGDPFALQVQNLTVTGTANLPNLVFTKSITVPGVGGPAPFNGQCCNIVFMDGQGANIPFSAIGNLSTFIHGPLSVGPQCNATDGNSFNCNTPGQYGFYAAYFTANFGSMLNGVSSGLPLPFFEPQATPTTPGANTYSYFLESCVDSSLALCTPPGDSGNFFVSVAIDNTHPVTITAPASLQNGLITGNVYKLVRSGTGGDINLGVITLGVPFVDNGSITTPEVRPTVNYTALIGAGWIIDKEMASNSGNCAQYTTGGRLASSGSPCGSGGGGGVTSIGGNGGAFTCTGSVTCTGTVINGAAAGTGTVTAFSSGNLSPLFTTSVATSTTTPALTYTLSTVAQNSVFAGPASGGAGVPSFQTAPTISAANMTSFPTFNQNTTGTAAAWTTARLLAGNSVTGSGNVPFANKFIVQGTSDAGLSGSQFLGALGSGLLKNTTTTGVLSVAFSSDVISLWTGTCSSSTFLRGDGACAAGVGGTVTTSGSPTTGFLPLFTASTVIGNSHMDDGISLAGAITVSEQFNVNNPSQPSGLQISPNTHNTFSGVGACNSGSEGILSVITDSNTVTWGATIAGGGSNRVLAYCDSVSWTVAAK